MADPRSQARIVRWARVAGLAYLVIIILGVLVEGFAGSALVVDGDPSATAANIEARQLLFRASTLAVLVLYATVLLLSFALYEVLRTVDRSLALLAFLFRSAEGIVGCTTVLLSLVVAQLLLGQESLALEAEQRHALSWVLLEARTTGMNIVLFLIGIGGPIYCYLFFTSRYIPRWLAAWGIGTYLSMAALATLTMLVPDLPAWLPMALFGAGTAFEVLIGLWLLIKAVEPAEAEPG